MTLSTAAKLDLVNSDPMVGYAINDGPQPEDDYLNFRLGREYQHYEKLRQDAHIHSRLQRRRLAVIGRRLITKPASLKRLDKKAYGLLMEALNDHINYEQLCNDLLDSGMLIGFSALAVEEWRRVKDLLVPVLKFVPQYRFNFTYYRETDYNYPLATGEELDRNRPIHEQIVMQNGYEVRLLTRTHPIQGLRIPRGRLILYSFGSSQGLPWGRGLGYQLYAWRQIKKESRAAWLLESDRLGTPPTLGTYDTEVIRLDQPQMRRDYENFLSFLRAISPNGHGLFPKGFDAKFIESLKAGGGANTHERLMDKADAQISEAILGEVSFAENGSGGSFAANSSQFEERESSLTDADCNLLDQQLRTQLWKPFFELNLPGARPPIIKRWTTEDARQIEEENLQEVNRSQRATTDKVLVETGFTPTDQYVKETYGQDWQVTPVQPTPDAVEGATIELQEWDLQKRAKLATGQLKGAFAGPHNSYPIASQKDVANAWQLAGHGRAPSGIRQSIVEIAKRFGWLSGLPREARAWAEEQGINFAQANRFITWRGFRIGIEYEVGSTRFDRPMRIAYGYFENHVGADKEALDVYIGPHFSSDRIFRITQLKEDGNFDEHKFGILFNTAAQFERAYKRQMPTHFFGGVEEVSLFEIECCAKRPRQLAFAEQKGRYSHISFKPPRAVQLAFKSAITNKNLNIGGGMETATKQWAAKLAAGEPVSPEKARMGYRFFKRNERFGQAPKDSPAWAAWAYWAGRAGQAWFNKLWRQMDAADKAKGVDATEIIFDPPDQCLEFLCGDDPGLPDNPTTLTGVVDLLSLLEHRQHLTLSGQATRAWAYSELRKYAHAA